MNKILIIEDDQIVANIYRNKLLVEGYKVEVALDGMEGLEMLESFNPEIVLLDLMLPKISGLDVLQRIRSSDTLKDIPVVVFSNTYMNSMVQSAWKAGATRCITKASCTPRQLLEVLRGVRPGNQEDSSGAPIAATTVTQSTNSSSSGAAVITSKSSGLQSQEEVRKAFSISFPGRVSVLRSLLQPAIKAGSESSRSEFMGQMHQRIRTLTGGARVAGFSRVAQMSAAIEALLSELHYKPQNVNPSTLRTVASALDFLGTLLGPGELEEKEMPSFGNILVVDDEPMSRRAIAFALERAHLNSISVATPRTALELLQDNKFDLIFLDIDMPEMSGLELCAKARAISAHKKTPIIFVTMLNDFDSRANSTMSGGTDLIAKPFLFLELAVKALCYVLRSRMEAPKILAGHDGRTALLTAVVQS